MSHDVETLLRQALHAEADAAVPWGDPAGTDPWPRVERAHRRTRALRRAGLAGVVVAALAIGGAVTARLDGGPPPPPAGETRDDTWQDLDDGRTRGEPVDDATRAAVATALAQPCCAPLGPDQYTYTGDPGDLRFLWNGDLGPQRAALVRATFTGVDTGDRRDMLAWVNESRAGRFETDRVWSGGPAVATSAYLTDGGEVRLLAVVRRGAGVDSSRALIRADGSVSREWTPERVSDGVADVEAGAVSDEHAPLELRVRYRGSAPGYATLEGFVPPGTGELTEADIARATVAARGDLSPAGVRQDVRSSLERLLGVLRSDAATTRPAVHWAGADQPGHAVVVSSAGYPGQGRVLSVRGLGGDGGIDWEWWGTAPASPVETPAGPITWRVPVPALAPTPTGHVVGWLLPEGATGVRVTVAGAPREVTTLDGLGLVDVGTGDAVRVQATLADGGTFDRVVEPGDAQRPLDPERYDLFPPGGPD